MSSTNHQIASLYAHMVATPSVGAWSPRAEKPILAGSQLQDIPHHLRCEWLALQSASCRRTADFAIIIATSRISDTKCSSGRVKSTDSAEHVQLGDHTVQNDAPSKHNVCLPATRTATAYLHHHISLSEFMLFHVHGCVGKASYSVSAPSP